MADLVLFNANVITLDPKLPKARLVAVRGNNITAVSNSGSPHDFKRNNTHLIDCRGNMVLPGFIHAHFHLLAFAESPVTLNLEPRNHVRSILDIQTMIRQAAQTLSPGHGSGVEDTMTFISMKGDIRPVGISTGRPRSIQSESFIASEELPC